MASKQAKRGKGSVFPFDLSKPIKRGILLKQGALHKAFRSRFFVLYAGFLVYYESESKWKLDVTRGDTMQVHFLLHPVQCYIELASFFLPPSVI